MDVYTSIIGKNTSLIEDITISVPGDHVCLRCIYDPQGQQKKYKLIFRRCREAKWSILESSEIDPKYADLLGITWEMNGNNRKSSIITTDLFELFIDYDEMDIEWDNDNR